MARKKYESDEQRYAAQRERTAQRQLEQRKAANDIAPLPEIVNKERRAEAEASFLRYCQIYRSDVFNKPFSPDHLQLIHDMETSARYGGLKALALPRGTGKTSLAKACAEWTLLTGLRKYIYLISATEDDAKDLLVTIKNTLSTNPLILEDFPEVAYPLMKIDGEARRCNGQRLHGKKTAIQWKDDRLVLPYVPGSKSSQSIVRVAGLTGSIRGKNHTTEDGLSYRPDFVILDDPQTRESANSPKQTKDRIETIQGDVLGLAGPGISIAALMPCTVVAKDDLADQMLDHDLFPEWRGTTTKMVTSWPEHEELWDEYKELRIQDLRKAASLPPNTPAEEVERMSRFPTATAFYLKNQKKMDKGAELVWHDRKEDWEISALQHAYNLRFKLGEVAFFAEYQNEPDADSTDTFTMLTPRQIEEKTNHLKRDQVPVETEVIVSFIDVQGPILYYGTCWFDKKFNGGLIDYGIWPKQKRRKLALRSVATKLTDVHKGMGEEAACRQGLLDLMDYLADKKYKSSDNTIWYNKLILIDTNYRTDIVHDAVMASDHKNVMPYHGRKIGVNRALISETKPKRGEKVGLEWIIPKTQKQRMVRHVRVDVNFWKTKFHTMLNTAIGDNGSFSLYKARGGHHSEWAEQVTAETPSLQWSEVRSAVMWELPPSRPDNHMLDIATGCCAGASILGITGVGEERSTSYGRRTRRRKVKTDAQGNVIRQKSS